MFNLRYLLSNRVVTQLLFSDTGPLKTLPRYTSGLCAGIGHTKPPLTHPTTCIYQQTRNTNFFNKHSADQLWKGVTSVSNAGRKRGRGKGNRKKHSMNLNKGQVIGVGRANILWPGLTTPVLRGKELVERQKLPVDPDRDAKLVKIRSEMGKFRPLKLAPIERGWSGKRMPGRSIGPPDPVANDTFDGFDTKVLEMKTVMRMTGNLGRMRRQSVFVVTGNGQGLVGIALAKAIDPRAALKTAKNSAGQKLMFIERYNDHTVMHDFFTQFGRTKVFVLKKPEGYGLVCHRAISECCKVIGIKNIHAKVEGAKNLQTIVKAFLIGLLRQKSHEQLAEETGLHVVEMCEEQDNFPQVVASPTVCREKVKEVPDFQQYCLDNRVILQKKKWPRFYKNLPSYEKYLVAAEARRNHDKVRFQLLCEYGDLRSFLFEKHPECRTALPGLKKKRKDDDTQEESSS